MNQDVNEYMTNTKKQNIQDTIEVRQGITERSSSLCSCLSERFRVSFVLEFQYKFQLIQVYLHLIIRNQLK